MNKQDILRYLTIFIIIAFVGEIFILGFRSGGEVATPTPVASTRTFAGTGDAAIKVTKLTNQFLVECNTTDETVLDRVRNIAGVESATYETAGIVFATTPVLENETAIVTANVATVLEDSCEGFAFYRLAYVLPQNNVSLTGTQKTGNVTVNTTVTITNYTLLSYSQLVSSPGVQALVDYRTSLNSTPTAKFSVETLNGITRKAQAKEILSSPQAAFSEGIGMIKGQVTQIVPRLLVKCAPAENYTSENISSVFSALNLIENQTAPDMYVVQYNQSIATANETASVILDSLKICATPVHVFQIGLVTPQNGSTCAKISTYDYSDRTEFEGAGLSGNECKNLTFRKLDSYALEQGAEGIITALDVNSAVNETVQAQITASTRNGYVTSAIAQEG